MAKEKNKFQNKSKEVAAAADFISPDKIKKEPEDATAVSGAPKTSDASKTIAVLSTSSSSKATNSQPKTILLVQTMNSRTGGIQSLLLPQGLRSLPSTTTTSTSDVGSLGARTKTTPAVTVVTSAGKNPSAATPKSTAECIPASIRKLITTSDGKVDATSLTSSVPQNVCELTFKSRTIQADGTVCTLKEYLCNFCQFKVAGRLAFQEHFGTHVFSCNHCSFRAFTRYEVLSHKRDRHPGVAEELAGYEGLDDFAGQMAALTAEWRRQASSSGDGATVDFVVNVTDTKIGGNPPIASLVLSSKPLTTVSTVSSSRISVSLTSTTSCLTSPTPSSVTPTTSRTLTVVTPTSQPQTLSLTAISSPVVSATLSMSHKKCAPTTTSSSLLTSSNVRTMASVGKASNDNYFTYKIVHDGAGKVQAYECDVCSFRSTKINEIFSHASTHSLTDLVKSNSVNVQWECFYCAYTSVLQANVVSHVIAKHPKQPIQLKRMVTNSAATPAAVPKPSPNRSILLKTLATPASLGSPSDAGTSALSSPPASIKKEKILDEAPSAGAGASSSKPDEADESCMWGCYYCSVQSVDRNEIILHLKKEHASQKLVITRRRITHTPAALASSSTGAKTDDNDRPEPGNEQPQSNPDDGANNEVQIGDIDSTDPQQSLAKLRRKQVFPRKVVDGAKNDDDHADENETTPNEAVTESKSGGSNRRNFQNLTKSKKDSGEGGRLSEEPLPTETTRNKRQKKVESDSTKRIRLADPESRDASWSVNGGNAAATTSSATQAEDASMPALEDVSYLMKSKARNEKDAKHVNNDRLRATSVSSTAVSSEPDKEMPVLHPERTVSGHDFGAAVRQSNGGVYVTPGRSNETSASKIATSGGETPDDLSVDDSRLFLFDTSSSVAYCSLCTATIRGLNARSHMREHVMTHTGGHLWTCPYCPFKCLRRSSIFRHVRSRHNNRPLRLIRRKNYDKMAAQDDGLSSATDVVATTAECRSNAVDIEIDSGKKLKSRAAPIRNTKLKGPRCVREARLGESVRSLWQCPTCGRRSLFRGALRVHVKVAHPSERGDAELKRAKRPSPRRRHQTKCKDCVVDIVPIENMHHYDTLSTLLLDNGASLIHDLDVDDFDEEEAPKEVPPTPAAPPNAEREKYRCGFCQFKDSDLKMVKVHSVESHPEHLVTVLDLFASRNMHRLYMCKQPECSYFTNRQEALMMHCCRRSTHEEAVEREKAEKPISETIAPSKEDPVRNFSPRGVTRAAPSGGRDSTFVSGSTSDPGKPRDLEARSVSNVLKKRLKTPEGPIDYNDDGTLKGIELEHGSTVLQCRYCDYPKTSDPVEIKAHLAAEHPRLQPIAIDVDAAAKGGVACLFVCSVFGCDYSSHYSNVFEHHMNLEHPEVESVRAVKKKRSHHRRTFPSSSSSDHRTTTLPFGAAAPQKSTDKTNVESSKTEEEILDKKTKSSDDGQDRESMASPAPISSLAFTPPPPAAASSAIGAGVSSERGNASGEYCRFVESASSPETRPQRKSTPERQRLLSFDSPCRYECVQCSFRSGALDLVKAHLVAKHRENFRSYYCIDRRARELRKRQKVLFCRDARCGYFCKLDEELENHEKFICTFSAPARLHHKGMLQYNLLPSSGADGGKPYKASPSSDETSIDSKMYQCSHCAFMTTDLHNIRMHVIAEHAATEGGFAEIKTERGSNDVANTVIVREPSSSRSMYDAVVDTVKIGDEEKVYTVL